MSDDGAAGRSAPRERWGYEAWLVASFIIIAVVVVVVVLVQASIPAGCGPCGMAMIGVAPLMLLGIVVLIINSIVIPRYLLRRRGQKTNAVSVISWIYGGASVLATLFVVGSFLITQVLGSLIRLS